MRSSCQLLHPLASPSDPSGTTMYLVSIKNFRGRSLSNFRTFIACSVWTSWAAPANLAILYKRVQSLARKDFCDAGILDSPHIRLTRGESRCQGEPSNPPLRVMGTVSLVPSSVSKDLFEETKLQWSWGICLAKRANIHSESKWRQIFFLNLPSGLQAS